MEWFVRKIAVKALKGLHQVYFAEKLRGYYRSVLSRGFHTGGIPWMKIGFKRKDREDEIRSSEKLPQIEAWISDKKKKIYRRSYALKIYRLSNDS